MSAFTAAYAAAAAARSAAGDALELAIRQSTVDPEVDALLRDRPGYADMMVKIAAVAATVPGLRAAADSAREAERLLSLDACYRCDGTGEYQAPTSYFQRGKPVCFACHGDGRSAKARNGV